MQKVSGKTKLSGHLQTTWYYSVTPTRSLKLNLKQICIGNLAVGILIICIIGEAQAIRFFVAILLPQGGESLTPRSIDKLSLIEGFFATLHNINNLFVRRIQVDVTLGNINFGFLEFDN